MRDRGDPDAAEPLQRRALAIGEKVLGPAHPDLGAQVINLASLLSAQGVCLVLLRLVFGIGVVGGWRRMPPAGRIPKLRPLNWLRYRCVGVGRYR